MVGGWCGGGGDVMVGGWCGGGGDVMVGGWCGGGGGSGGRVVWWWCW